MRAIGIIKVEKYGSLIGWGDTFIHEFIVNGFKNWSNRRDKGGSCHTSADVPIPNVSIIQKALHGLKIGIDG